MASPATRDQQVTSSSYGSSRELPSGWAWTTLGDLSQIVQGQSPPSSTYNEDGKGLPFYQGKLEFGPLCPTPRKWCSAPTKTAEKGDVLVSVRAPVGPTNICPAKSCIGRGLAAVRPLAGVETLFLLYLLRTNAARLAGKGTGSTFSAISGDDLRSLDVPVPPLPEQRRIVAKIEERLSVVDAEEKAIEAALAQAARLRQAILKRAFEGRLVPQDPTDEPASELLKRIREARAKQPIAKRRGRIAIRQEPIAKRRGKKE
ncbi:MAG: Type-1 restriction enzyme MjaXIP specificity protein [Candidatus Methanofastidiosum methylothiophilum]|uniref:Type-1 restriction enzyme MjaXIP specificity protein n=1 Tax=Candidatus Methanofastidiosum methylothiophilum TaxID=1705564 RepID=A0A150J1V2_9EURY|nr:MAG: Type-1 restriction enzyme MjaXIP specificity protein [Candidatus Methanofastidiosum methylthiophilus]